MKQLNDEILKSTNEMWADRPVVFGDGDKNAIIMLIGEAPGAEEVKVSVVEIRRFFHTKIQFQEE